MNQDIERVLLSEEEIAAKVAEIGAKISEDYAGKDPIIISVLKGSFMFMADLVRAITIPCTVDFMSVSSYGSGTSSSGEVKIVKDFDNSIENRHVIIVEDILDSGRTLSYLMKTLKAARHGHLHRGAPLARRYHDAVLLQKKIRHKYTRQ